MATVFLFGAGASYGSGDCTPQVPTLGVSPPPDGRTLIGELQQLGGVASTIGMDIESRFLSRFEDGMAAFIAARGADLTKFVREMALYLLQFQPGQNNAYLRLIRTAQERRHPILCATTNYDVLIERAADLIGLRFRHDNLRSRNSLSILKLHGSPLVGPDYGTNRVFIQIMEEATAKGIVEAPARLVPYDVAERLCREETENHAMAPSVALYSEQKQVLHMADWTRNQQRLFSKVLQQAKQIIVVGLRVYEPDRHIWQPLARSPLPLYYVDVFPEPFLRWRNKWKRKNTKVLRGGFLDQLPSILELLN